MSFSKRSCLWHGSVLGQPWFGQVSVACFKIIPSLPDTSCESWETEILPLSYITGVGKEAFFDMMSVRIFAAFFAVGLQTV